MYSIFAQNAVNSCNVVIAAVYAHLKRKREKARRLRIEIEIYPLQKGRLRTSFPRWGVTVLPIENLVGAKVGST